MEIKEMEQEMGGILSFLESEVASGSYLWMKLVVFSRLLSLF